MKANTVAFSRRSCGTTIASDVFSTYPTRVMIREEESGIDPDTHPAKDIFMPKSHLTASILSHGNSYMNTDPDLNFSFSASDGSCGTISGVSTGKSVSVNKLHVGDANKEDGVRINTTITLDSDAETMLWYLPPPVQVFENGRCKQVTTVNVSHAEADCSSGSAFLLDWFAHGGRNSSSRWRLGKLDSLMSVSLAGEEVFRDSFLLTNSNNNNKNNNNNNDNDLKLSTHMPVNVGCVACAVLVGPQMAALAQYLQKTYGERSQWNDQNEVVKSPSLPPGCSLVSCGPLLQPTCINPKSTCYKHNCVLRVAGESMERVGEFLKSLVGGSAFDEFIGAAAADPNPEETPSQPALLPYNFPSLTPTILGPLPYTSSTPPSAPTAIPTSPMTSFQLIDPTTPTGSFAHSNTLEAANFFNLLLGKNEDVGDSLTQYVYTSMLQAIGSQVVFVIGAKRCLEKLQDDAAVATAVFNEWEDIDRLMSASTTSSVARRASCLQGIGMIRAYAAAFDETADILKALKRRIMSASTKSGFERGHGSTVFGATCAILKTSDVECVNMFLYCLCRDMVSAAVRMNLVGPLEGSGIIRQVTRNVEEIVRERVIEGADIDVKGAFMCSPILEILANSHERLYTRLFNS
ncbi:hypothetical protein TrST_g13577 [Triparma strigata]|uniref:Urease accessory protein n=1 Tax=Triparma strigata TaxID=1606541 RepID=A0A9W7A717_9STRA|nr:hypothetical protein TrST_g13577 [Triparma strigata]